MTTADKLVRPVSAKTADYTLNAGDYGKIFTNRGAAGAVTFTLPAAASTPAGFFADFYVIADQTVTVAAAAGEMIALNDAAANSIAFSTASEKIGGHVNVVCDGTSWLMRHNAETTATPVIAT